VVNGSNVAGREAAKVGGKGLTGGYGDVGPAKGARGEERLQRIVEQEAILATLAQVTTKVLGSVERVAAQKDLGDGGAANGEASPAACGRPSHGSGEADGSQDPILIAAGLQKWGTVRRVVAEPYR